MSDETRVVYTGMRKESKLRRETNRKCSTHKLKQLGVPFSEHNKGYHLVVTAIPEVIDYWPSTGKWISREHGVESRGLKNLLNYLKENGYEFTSPL